MWWPSLWTWTVDTVAPAAVHKRTTVRYGRLALTWGSLTAVGAARIVVLRSMSPKKPPARDVYRGSGSGYVDPKFANGVYHRYRIVASDQAGNVSPAVDVVVAPSALLLAPKDGARLRGPATLRWRAAPKASFYNVQLFRAGKKVLSIWPRGPHLQLTRGWRYLGHSYRLKAGVYTWYVWPGFGPLAKSRYGQLLGRGSFSIAG